MAQPAYVRSCYSVLSQHDLPPQPPNTRGRPLKAIGWVFLSGLALFVALLAPISVLFWYIFKNHQTIRDGYYIYTTAPVHQILTISQVTSKTAEKVVAPVMAIFAYLCAAEWLRNSEPRTGCGDTPLPTPIQVGIAQTVLGAANFFAMSDGLKYLFRGGGHARRPEMPKFVYMAVVLLCWLSILELLAFCADFAFHQTTVNADVWLHPTASQLEIWKKAADAVVTPPLDWSVDPKTVVPTADDTANAGAADLSADVSSMMMGRRVNETFCASWSRSHDFAINAARESCGFYTGGAFNAVYYASKGQKAFSNSSSVHAVAWTDDTHSIMVAPIQPNFSYIAESPGVKASCVPITRECSQCDSLGSDPFETCGPTSGLTLRCSGTHMFNATATTSGWIGNDGNVNISSGVPSSNPLRWGTVVTSQAYLEYENPGQGSGTYDKTTGFLIWGTDGATNVLYCDVFVRLVKYRFDPPSRFRTLSTLDFSHEAAHRFVWTFTGTFGKEGVYAPDLIGTLIDGAGRSSADPYPNVYGRTLSRYVMAYGAQMMASIPLAVLNGTTVPGTRVHMVALSIFAGIVLVESITILFVSFASVATIWICNDQTIGVARKRLTAPFALLCQTYGTPRATRRERGRRGKLNDFIEDNLRLFEDEMQSGARGLILRKVPHSATPYTSAASRSEGWSLIAA